MKNTAFLVLEDGSYFRGQGFGATGKVSGEVVFNTGMVGYELSLTDPSYQGQILTQTYPLIGNYGVPLPAVDKWGLPNLEYNKVVPSAYVVSEVNKVAKPRTLNNWFVEQKKIGIEGIDTRALTKKLREHGVMLGIMAHGDYDVHDLLKEKIEDPNKRNLVAEVSRTKPEIFGEGRRIVLIDTGVKTNMIRCLVKRDCQVTVVPWNTPADKILGYDPEGIVVSNGPGDPAVLTETVNTVKQLMEKNIPLFGICLGNQILALAAGAKTYKLKYGHRGQNQPCVDKITGRCYITSQNHGFAVDEATLPFGVDSWMTNANDGTNEGLRWREKRIFSVQFHPEHNPGPWDTEFLFDAFLGVIK